jgi:hypothetical protein
VSATTTVICRSWSSLLSVMVRFLFRERLRAPFV